MAYRRPKFTDEQINFLRTLNGLTRKEQLDIFNEKYNTDDNYYTFKWHMQKLGIKSSGDCRFKKNHNPWNKGMSVDEYRTHFTEDEWYEMTHRVLDAPHKRHKIGDVILIKDNHNNMQPWIYIRTGNRPIYENLKQLDRFIWEKKVGPIPESHCIFHLNRNHLDCRIDNLVCIPFGYISSLTKYLSSEFTEVNKTTIKYLELKHTLRKKEKERNG